MTHLIAVSWVLFSLFLDASSNNTLAKIRAEDANRFVGKEATICGRIVAYDCDQSRYYVFLNLDKPYWSGEVSIAIQSAERTSRGAQFEDRYLYQDVCATGEVKRLDGRIVVTPRNPASLVLRSSEKPVRVFARHVIRSCSPGVELPTVLHQVEPSYTWPAMQAKKEGRLLLDAVVLPDGTVEDLRVVVSLDRSTGLDEQGTAAVKQWRFAPGRYLGRPVAMVVSIELEFRLK